MADNFSDMNIGLDSPAREAVAVTPHDTTELTNVCRALYVGGSGNIVLTTAESGTAITFTNVPVGILPVGCRRVNSTNTTATNIVALY